jgi:glycosyltransferase family protein
MKQFLLKIYYLFLELTKRLTVIKNYFISILINPPTVRTTDETLEKILRDNCSVSRFGDGEFGLMYGENLIFQTNHPELRKKLKEIIKSNQENHIVCIPNVFNNNLDNFTEKSKRYWMNYLKVKRHKIYKMLDMKKNYNDALVTRLYIDQADKTRVKKRFDLFKYIWKNREIVIVEGEKSRLGIGNDLFSAARSIERIICPAQDAFTKYELILQEVLIHSTSKLILIALGPTATVLAYDLSQLGYQAIDIGHIDIEYEWFLNNATEKVAVRNKYIGEIPNGTNVETPRDVTYEKEIRIRII